MAEKVKFTKKEKKDIGKVARLVMTLNMSMFLKGGIDYRNLNFPLSVVVQKRGK
ncbi:hypothetical protein LCGC14_3111790 [marine sediment metagenome]|uniref:Uncharacterized protein n=1 Tax=marine sediment metagenome TaxID=412755 RepID=A0A0F8YC80_9ZZZZ